MTFYSRLARALGFLQPDDLPTFIGTCFAWTTQLVQSDVFEQMDSEEQQAAALLRTGLDALIATVGVPIGSLDDRNNQLTTLATWAALLDDAEDGFQIIARGANSLSRLDLDDIRSWYLDMYTAIPVLRHQAAADVRELGFNMTRLWLGRMATAGTQDPMTASISAFEPFRSRQGLYSLVRLPGTGPLDPADRWPWRSGSTHVSVIDETKSAAERVREAFTRTTPERVGLFLEGPVDPVILRDLESVSRTSSTQLVEAAFQAGVHGLIAACREEEGRPLSGDAAVQAIYEGIALNARAISEAEPSHVDAFLDRLREMLREQISTQVSLDLDALLMHVKFATMTAVARGVLESPTGAEMGAAVWFMNHFDFEM